LRIALYIGVKVECSLLLGRENGGYVVC